MVMVGLLTVLLAVGMQRLLRTGRGAVWAPRLLGLFGVAYIVGGLLRADPVAGFPPGTTPEMVHTTWQGGVQNASRGVSTLLLIATSLVIARRFAAEGRLGAAWLCGAGIPMVFAALTVAGLAIGGNPSALAFLATPWVWVTGLAVHLYRREAERALGKSERASFSSAVVASALFVLLVAIPTWAAAQPAAGYAMSSGRLGASVAIVLGLMGAVIGGLSLRRPTGPLGTASGRRGALVALATGLVGMAIGALVVATSDGGIGTGNGRGGAFVALVVGLIAMSFGALALARSRRTV
jgi:hypothetical protein